MLPCPPTLTTSLLKLAQEVTEDAHMHTWRVDCFFYVQKRSSQELMWESGLRSKESTLEV